jgi:hypothetical protein
LGIFDQILEVWGWALLSYSNGVEALADGIKQFFSSIPLIDATPLATWAEQSFRGLVKKLGLEAIDMGTPKPVLVNTLHVAKASNNNIAKGLIELKGLYSALPGSGSGSVVDASLNGILDLAELKGCEFLESELTLFTISFGDVPGLPEIPIKITLPSNVIETGQSQLTDIRNSIGKFNGTGGGSVVWE